GLYCSLLRPEERWGGGAARTAPKPIPAGSREDRARATPSALRDRGSALAALVGARRRHRAPGPGVPVPGRGTDAHGDRRRARGGHGEVGWSPDRRPVLGGRWPPAGDPAPAAPEAGPGREGHAHGSL